MKNKSLRAKYLYRFVLPGALCAAISCTASIPAFADEIIVEDAALVTEADASDAVDVVVEDDDVIEIDTEAEDASAQKETIAIEDSSELTDTDETADTPETPTRVSVHDPSIVKADGMYYVLGSHTASASSSDLIQWTQLNSDYGNPESTPFYVNLKETFEKPFQWAGYNDGDCAGGYAIWAPDAIWNPYYKWDDGSTGAYMLYCCTSSTWRRSCISYLVSKTFDGTYTYVDTIIYSGFTKTGAVDGNSSRNTKWDNDYLNLNTLLERGRENGGIDEISDNWFDQTGGWNHLYAPNAIDPNLFFDA